MRGGQTILCRLWLLERTIISIKQLKVLVQNKYSEIRPLIAVEREHQTIVLAILVSDTFCCFSVPWKARCCCWQDLLSGPFFRRLHPRAKHVSKTAAYNQLPLWVNQYSSPQAWRTLAGAPPQRRLGSDARADRQPPLMPDPHILKNMPRLYFLKYLRRKVQRFQRTNSSWVSPFIDGLVLGANSIIGWQSQNCQATPSLNGNFQLDLHCMPRQWPWASACL